MGISICHLAAFPAGFSREEALDILLRFEGNNTDGVGSVFVRHGEFVIDKWAKSLSKILRNDKPFLAHMPYDGWTIAHLRAASHGGKMIVNTHPFVVGPWAVAHNGVWTEFTRAAPSTGGRQKPISYH